MTAPLLIAKNDRLELELLPQMANRHGLITARRERARPSRCNRWRNRSRV